MEIFSKKTTALYRTVLLLAFLFVHPKGTFPQGWSIRQPMPTARYGACSAVLDGKIYVIGGSLSGNQGLSNVEVYDPSTDTWDTDFPPLNIPRLNAAAVTFGEKIVVSGGRNGSELLDDVEVYDPLVNTWGLAQSLHEKKEGHAAAVHAGTIYVMGGYEDQGILLDDVEYLDTEEGEWKEASWELSLPRASLSAVSLSDSIFIMGGFYFGPIDRFERYHINTGLSQREPLVIARASAGSAVSDGTIYLAGGISHSNLLSSLESFSNDQQGWIELESMSKTRMSLVLEAVDGRLYAIGGKGGIGGNTPFNLVEEYAISTAIKEDQPSSPTRVLHLDQNHPNPFNGGTDITFEIPNDRERIELSIFDARGRLVKVLSNEILGSGRHQIHWDGFDRTGAEVSTGIYLYTIKYGNTVMTRKMFLAR